MKDPDSGVMRAPMGDYAPRAVWNLISSRWQDGASDEEFSVVNPATAEEHLRYRGADVEQVTAAAQAALDAFPAWSMLPAIERYRIMSAAADLMRERSETIAIDLTMEQGKPFLQSRAEVHGSADVMTWFAEQGRRLYARTVPGENPDILQSVVPKPIGPVAIFTPWNSPLGTSVRTTAAALAAGCTVVLKSASETPLSVMGFAQALLDAGLPDGVVNVLFGNSRDISSALIAHPAIRKISLTGSIPVGRALAEQAGREIKPLSLELGGHAPVVIFDDADLEGVVDALIPAKFDNAGQICISPSRFYVQKGRHDRFVDTVVRGVSTLKIGEGWVEGIDMGPLANRRRLEEVEKLVADAVSHGAKLVAGGIRLGNRGFFFAPTVLANVPDQAEIMKSEPFGPVVVITPFDSEPEVISRANALPFGLAGYVFSTDIEKLQRVGNALEIGMVGLNNFNVSRPELPFTGVKQSGFGYACGEEGLEGFVVRRTVTQRL